MDKKGVCVSSCIVDQRSKNKHDLNLFVSDCLSAFVYISLMFLDVIMFHGKTVEPNPIKFFTKLADII